MGRRILAAAILLVVVPAIPAEASPRLCRQLEAQLAALPAGGGSRASPQARRYDAAIQRQQDQIKKGREQGKQAGCGRAMVGRAVAFCGNLAATMERMEGNLAKLQRERKRLGGGGGDTRRERARLTAAIDANGCRSPRRSEPKPAREAAARPDQATGRRPAAGRSLSGSYRTLCVRTCDGYYFPVSFSVSQGAFERDQQVCRAMCPGTEVELHFHHATGEESEDMVSTATGRPYTEMPTAFRYRQPGTQLVPGCGCGAAARGERGFTVIGGDHGDGSPRDEPAAQETASAPPPILDHARLRKGLPAKEPASDEDERSIRVVGPTFLPDPEAAIDLQAPARNRGR